MSYATGVIIYIVLFAVAIVLPVALGTISFGALASNQSPGLVVLLSVPVMLVGPRVIDRLRNKIPLLPESFRRRRSLIRVIASGIIAMAHLLFFGSLGLGAFFVLTTNSSVPTGLIAGRSIYAYWLGIVLMEANYWQWSRHRRSSNTKNYRLHVAATVALIVLISIALNQSVRNSRYVDTLSYLERQDLAWSLGLAREVQRFVDQFYIREKRLPCTGDVVVDIDALLGRHRDRFKIQFIDCGRFTIAVPNLDGVIDQDLIFSATPSGSEGTESLTWQCTSAYHEQIERHTKGKCVYGPSIIGVSR